jgi:hypothetical protein
MKKKSFFLIGMTSVLLAFGMTGCPQGTNTVTKTVTVPGTSTPVQGQPGHIPVVAYNADMVETFLTVGLGPGVDRLYIQSVIELDGSYALGSGKTIVVTENPPPSYNTLALPNAGALFAIGPTTNTAELKVNGTLKLEDGSNVVLGSSTDYTQKGKLTIEGGGKVIVASTAAIKVTTASRIVLAEENSVLTFEAPDAGNVTPVGTFGGDDKEIGTDPDTSLIVTPPSGNAATNATASTVSGSGNTGLDDDVHITVKSTANADEIANSFSGSVTTVTYTGEGTLTSSLPLVAGKTLIVDGELTVGSSGTLTAEAGAEVAIPNGAKVTVASGGLVDLEELDDEDAVTLGGTIEVASNGTLKLPVDIGGENIADKVPQIGWGTDGSIVLTGGSAILVGGDVFIGTGGEYTWNASDTTSTVTLKEGEIELTGNLTSAQDNSINDKLTIKNGATLTVSDELTVNGTLTNNGTITLVGEIDGGGTYTGSGDFFVSKVDALNSAVAFNVPEISLNEDFYDEGHTTYIAIDAREADRLADKAITIKGLGKNSVKELGVGILIANDNITLDGVKFNISDRNKAAIVEWASYRAAVSVSRASNSTTLLTEANIANHNVTVKNTDITFTNAATGNVAGIFISGIGALTSPPTGITITDNKVSVTNIGNAAQALAVRNYSPDIVITNNVLSSTNTARQGVNAPASALFMSIHPSNVDDNDTPNISGNTLTGIFGFFINISSPGNDMGIPKLFADRFGTKDSVWAASNASDTDSFYRKLFNTLVPQTAATAGNKYSSITMWLGGTTPNSSPNGKWAIESFEIDSSNKVVAVDYWGPSAIAASGTEYDVGEGKDVNSTTTGGAAGRITINGTGAVTNRDETFRWTPTTEATNSTGNINTW